jgi:hypothetical protein
MGEVTAMIQFLKFAAISGVPFGVVMAAWRSFSGSEHALRSGVLGAIFFGAFMATWMVWRIRRSRLEVKGP